MSVPAIVADDINREHRLARAAAESAVAHAIRCGELLEAKKGELPHGEFQKWIEANCEFSYRQAARYMEAGRLKSDTRVTFGSLRQLLASGSRQQALPEPADVPDEHVEVTRFRQLRREFDAARDAIEQRTDELHSLMNSVKRDPALMTAVGKRLGFLVQDWSLVDRMTSLMRETVQSGERARDCGITWTEWTGTPAEPWMDLKVQPADFYRQLNMDPFAVLQSAARAPLLWGDFDDGHVLIQRAPIGGKYFDVAATIANGGRGQLLRKPIAYRGLDAAIHMVTDGIARADIEWAYIAAKRGALREYFAPYYEAAEVAA